MRILDVNVRYVEFLCATFENINSFSVPVSWQKYFIHYSGEVRSVENPGLIVIPNGSTQNFINRIESFGRTSDFFNFIERSQFGGIN